MEYQEVNRVRLTAEPYAVYFHAKGGCAKSIVSDMARFDNARVVSWRTDTACNPECVRFALFVPKGTLPASIERWRSFVVGAEIVTGDAMETLGKTYRLPAKEGDTQRGIDAPKGER